MKIRKLFALLAILTSAALGAACSAGTTDSTETSTTTSDAAGSSSTTNGTGNTAGNGGPQAGGQPGGPGGVDAASVSTETELIALVQQAYGEASLGLHRGHQPVQAVLIEVLGISHEEMHVRMEERGQNLAAVATDLGIDPQTLIDALVESWSPAIDKVLAAGQITEAEAAQYRQALRDAFTFKVTWNGKDATPTFSGVSA